MTGARGRLEAVQLSAHGTICSSRASRLACDPSALASQTIASNVTSVQLAVNAKGEALVTFTRASGLPGAYWPGARSNADPRPTRHVPQQRFKLDWTRRSGQVPQGAGTGARSRTSAGRTAVRRFRTASRRAPPRTAPTGGFRSGSAPAASRRPCLPPERTWPGSSTSRTGRRRPRRARGLAELDVRRRLPGAVRTAPVPKESPCTASGRRHAARSRPQRALRLHRHVQLGLRPGLEARRRKGDASRQRRLLLQLRPARAARRPAIRQSRPSRARESATASPSWARA